MTIVDKLTPVAYQPLRLIIEVRADEVLTADSLRLSADMRILNVYSQTVGNDAPAPQTTQNELAMFLAWIQRNLTAYETVTGLVRHYEGE